MTVIESALVGHENKLLVIGDLLIDETHYVTVPRLSPEAPVPIAWLSGPPTKEPGGAGLGAVFGSSQGIEIDFATCCDFETARWLTDEFGIHNIVYHEEEPVINVTKTRFIDTISGYYLLRVDNDGISSRPFLDEIVAACWEQAVLNSIDRVAAITILDYNKGLLADEAQVQRIISYAKRVSVPVYTASKTSDLTKFTGSDIIRLNKKEYHAACQTLNVSTPEEFISLLSLNGLMVSMGKEGAWIVYGDRTYSYCTESSHTSNLVDVAGCGDVFDMSFCFQRYLQNYTPARSLSTATDIASAFAYKDRETRLCQR